MFACHRLSGYGARLLLAFFATALPVGGVAAQPTTYTYAGTPYVNASGTFTTSMRITGSFRTANPLPANMPPTAIGPAGSGAAIAWSFTNGVDTFTEANSRELYGDPTWFVVGTNQFGDVVAYAIGLIRPLPPHAVNDALDALVIASETLGNTVQAVDQGQCVAVDSGNVCINLPLAGTGVAVDNTESGAFLRNFVAPVPVDSTAALAMLAGLLVAAALFARRRGTPGRRSS
jgi:hypothetical protein